MTPDERAAHVAALKKVIAIAARYMEIPLPEISTYPGTDNVHWSLWGNSAARQMAVLEEALDCELTPAARQASSGRDYYELKGTLGGLAVTVSAPAELVAERKVTGTTVTEVVEWVRLPADPESGEHA
jgi:hypothetical protein